MVYELNDVQKAAALFDGWKETLIYSCLQGAMGKIFVTDIAAPKSALAFVGCFAFFAGEPNRELVEHKPDGFVIMTPQNDEWAALIETAYPNAKKATRYAIKKDTRFDTAALKKNLSLLSAGYELKKIDSALYDKCLENELTKDFVSVFTSKEAFLKEGLGMVIVKGGQIVSGASSYTRYREGIEIEIDTLPAERRKGLALICASALILACLEEGLYPSWDAMNSDSLALAKKLGYEFSHEYRVYEVGGEN